MKRTIFATFILVLLVFGFIEDTYSQEPGKTEMKQIFRKFRNYRFGSIALYQITNIAEIRKAIEAKEVSATGTQKVDNSAVEKINEQLKSKFYEFYIQSPDKNSIAQALAGENIDFKDEEIDQLFAFYEAQRNKTSGDKIEYVFVITTKPKMGNRPETIIGMITSTESSDTYIDKVLKNVSNNNIYIHDELKQFDLDSSYSASTMYDLVVNSFVQMNVRNRTTEMQGIGTPGFFYTRNFGIAQTISANEADLTPYDIQKYMQISDVQPQNMGLNQNEVILSPDLISWKHYALPTTWDGDVKLVDSFGITNSTLPEYGLELRYGIDEINYSSLWSERLTAYALWSSVKLGVILPTAGWSNMSTDLFDQQRNLTHASAGVAGKFDFPIKVIPKSGLFSMSFGYVFGDAVESDYKKRDLNPDNYEYTDGDNDYLIRANFNFHYTFGLAIDEDFKFRFGVGFTGYSVERWYNKVYQDEEGLNRIDYVSFNDEFIAGLSGRVEFMVTNIATPYGATLQYFDESLSGGIWLQIPLYKNNFALRLEAKGFSPLFRGTDHSWEVGGIFTPMARLIVNF